MLLLQTGFVASTPRRKRPRSSRSSPTSIAETAPLLEKERECQRQVVALASDVGLTLATEHVADELAQLWIERGAVAGRRVGSEVEIGAAGERIRAARHGCSGRRDERPCRRLRQRERLDLRGPPGHRSVGDSVAVL